MHSTLQHIEASLIDHILGQKTNLRKYRTAEIVPCVLYDLYGIKIKHDSMQNSSTSIDT